MGNVSELQRHKRTVHDKIFKFVCHLCGKRTYHKDDLNAHMVTAHGIGERQFKCDQCDKAFAQKKILNEHKKRHDKSTLYQCQHCEKTFWMKTDLKIHVRMM